MPNLRRRHVHDQFDVRFHFKQSMAQSRWNYYVDFRLYAAHGHARIAIFGSLLDGCLVSSIGSV